MKNVQKVLAGVVFGVAGMSAAQAEWSANIGVANTYIFRGVDFEGGHVFGGLDWSSDVSGLYAGAWVGSVGGGDDELDLYGGYAFDLGGGVGLDLGVITYLFPSADELNRSGDSHLNATELYLGLGAGAFSFTTWYGFGFDNNATGVGDSSDEEYVYLDANAELPAWGQFSLGLHVGYWKGVGDDYDDASFNGDDDYVDYGVSLSAGDFSIAVMATDLDDDHGFVTSGFVEGAQERPQVVVSWSKTWEGLGNAK